MWTGDTFQIWIKVLYLFDRCIESESTRRNVKEGSMVHMRIQSVFDPNHPDNKVKKFCIKSTLSVDTTSNTFLSPGLSSVLDPKVLEQALFCFI